MPHVPICSSHKVLSVSGVTVWLWGSGWNQNWGRGGICWMCIIIWPGFLFHPLTTAVLPVWWKPCATIFVPQWWGGTNGYFHTSWCHHCAAGSMMAGYLLGASVVHQYKHTDEHMHMYKWFKLSHELIWHTPVLTEIHSKFLSKNKTKM